ncbi:MAG: hypothetical protein JO066_13380 [Verrucomicrobia bacterium]|nr:hypothetical protein [Verrucomicrobiota bacterium]
MYLPGALKTKLGLDMEQTLTLQREIRAALTELRDKGKVALGGDAANGKPVPQTTAATGQRQRRRSEP